MKKELWLEFGWNKPNIGMDMCWYNEGRANEIGYWIKNYFIWRKKYKTGIYFLWRYGRKNHFLINN
jgi:hypothetical protein